MVHDCHNTQVRLRDILSLKALCDNASSGCDWVGELPSLDEHLASCDFSLLPCPNKCHNWSKVVELLHRDIDKHTKEECPRHQYRCPHCQEEGEYQEMRTKHLKICSTLEVPCPKRRCKAHIRRCDLPKHCEECLFDKVPCKYSILGCDEVVQRNPGPLLEKSLLNYSTSWRTRTITLHVSGSVPGQSIVDKELPSSGLGYRHYIHHSTLGHQVATCELPVPPG